MPGPTDCAAGAFRRFSWAMVGQLIHQHEFAEGPMDLAAYSVLLKNHAQQAQTLKTLGTSLRLTSQSRYRAETAARTIDGKRTGPRPWDI